MGPTQRLRRLLESRLQYDDQSHVSRPKRKLQSCDECLKELNEYRKKPIKKTSVFNIVRKDVGAIESARRIIYAKSFKIAIRIKNKIWKMHRLKSWQKKSLSSPKKPKTSRSSTGQSGNRERHGSLRKKSPNTERQ